MMHTVASCVNGKRPLTSIACMAFISLFVGACKKADDNGVTLKLMNRWNLVQINDTSYIPNTAPDISKYDGGGDDYFDFRKDGKLYSSIRKALDTAQYTYSEANLKLNVGNFQFRIVSITDNSLVLWDPHFSSGGTMGYISHKVTLRR